MWAEYSSLFIVLLVLIVVFLLVRLGKVTKSSMTTPTPTWGDLDHITMAGRWAEKSDGHNGNPRERFVISAHETPIYNDPPGLDVVDHQRRNYPVGAGIESMTSPTQIRKKKHDDYTLNEKRLQGH